MIIAQLMGAKFMSYDKGMTYIEHIREQSAENNWASRKKQLMGVHRKLHSKEFYYLYSSPNIRRVIHRNNGKRWPGSVAYIGEIRDAYKILATNTEK
jgi:hypothetical protein